MIFLMDWNSEVAEGNKAIVKGTHFSNAVTTDTITVELVAPETVGRTVSTTVNSVVIAATIALSITGLLHS